MAVLLITDSVKARQQARVVTPVIWQEFQSAKDCLTPIIVGGIKANSIPAVLLRGMKAPTLYFKSMEDSEWEYTHFTIYHPFDWSGSSISFIRDWDSHRHDTEGILIRRSKRPGRISRKHRIDACTVFHNSLQFQRNSDLQFHIQAQGHGIRDAGKNVKADRNYLRYSNFDLVDWGNWPGEELAKLKREFNRTGVNFPDQMYDSSMRLRFSNPAYNGGLTHLPGDIWYRPDILFECAERINRI